MIRKYLFLLTIITSSMTVKAEIINGRVNFRLKPNGPILFILKDGEKVECGELKNGWYKISVSIKTTQKQLDEGYDVKKGDKLIGLKGKLLGVALSDVPPEASMPTSAYMEIFGYVRVSDIKVNSIPENNLDSILKVKAAHLQYVDLKDFLKREEYFKADLLHKTLPKMDEYCIYESTVVDESPGYRIGLIFQDNYLVAIEHSRALKTKPAKEYPVLDRNKIFIVKPPKGMSEAAFVKKVNDSNIGAD